MQYTKQGTPSNNEVNAARFPAGVTFLAIMGVSLMGYAFLGRGFAYAGIPPLFIGEVILFIGLMTWTLTG